MKVISTWMKPRKMHALPQLRLELLHPGANQRRLEIITLTTGMVLLLAASAHYIYTSSQISIMEASIARATNAIEVSNMPIDNEDAKAVQEAIAHLDLPWNKLFSALESAASEKINLISVEPDMSKGTVKIVADALNTYDMLEYVRGLTKQAALHNVILTEYEVKNDTPEQSLRFTLTASWGSSL